MEIPLLFATIVALITSGLFIYGCIQLLRAPSSNRYIARLAQKLGLLRAEENPIIEPSGHDWEAAGVFNPAAIEDGGRVHLFYRAIGSDGLSRIGYASSTDGRTFDRLPYPVFAIAGPSVGSDDVRRNRLALHPGLIASGGSWGGVEDPRAVVIDDTLYLTFTAFEGWSSLRMGLTTLAMEDFRQQRWRWSPPVYLSRPGEVHKNWVLFPEKINGQYALLHSLHSGSRDRVLIDYVDDIATEPEEFIDSPYRPVTDPNAWDSTLRGVGPPPIRTPQGWLVLYHATDRREPSKYKIGTLLLDLADPTRVLARSGAPVLEPVARYENERGKAGVVYASGATVNGDTLTVYYGGADYVVCMARHSISKLIGHLSTGLGRAPSQIVPA